MRKRARKAKRGIRNAASPDVAPPATPAGTEDSSRSQPIGARFDAWTKRNLAVVALVFAALLLSSIITIASSTTNVNDWYTRTFKWRENEYRKLAGLQAGFSMEKFKATLGDPVFRTKVRETKRKLVDSIFSGRGYWVDVISDDSEVVLAYSVTSCNREFKPTFRLNSAPPSAITLNKTAFSDVKLDGAADTMVFISGATANSYAFQLIYQGNPSNYRTYAWGLNDACQWYSATDNKGLPYRWLEWNASEEGQKYVETEKMGPGLKNLLAVSAVNTYVETAPFAADIFREDFGIKELYPQQLGVDRIIVRSYPGQDLVPWTPCDVPAHC